MIYAANKKSFDVEISLTPRKTDIIARKDSGDNDTFFFVPVMNLLIPYNENRKNATLLQQYKKAGFVISENILFYTK